MEPEVEITGRKRRSSTPAGPPGHIFEGIEPELVAEVENQAPELNTEALVYKNDAERRVADYMGRRMYEKTRKALAEEADEAGRRGRERRVAFVEEDWPDWSALSDTQKQIWSERAFTR